jgi:hypothetical protein
MYRAAERLNPDRYRRLTRRCTPDGSPDQKVGEFHLQHHDSGGPTTPTPTMDTL